MDGFDIAILVLVIILGIIILISSIWGCCLLQRVPQEVPQDETETEIETIGV